MDVVLVSLKGVNWMRECLRLFKADASVGGMSPAQIVTIVGFFSPSGGFPWLCL